MGPRSDGSRGRKCDRRVPARYRAFARHVWAWNNLGFTYLELKRHQDAADALVEATRRPAAEAYMFNNLGTAREQLDQLDEAREAYERGGALGSQQALASRKRLEGVATIVVMHSAPPAAQATPATAQGYDIAEEMPELPAATESADDEDAGDDASESSPQPSI